MHVIGVEHIRCTTIMVDNHHQLLQLQLQQRHQLLVLPPLKAVMVMDSKILIIMEIAITTTIIITTTTTITVTTTMTMVKQIMILLHTYTHVYIYIARQLILKKNNLGKYTLLANDDIRNLNLTHG